MLRRAVTSGRPTLDADGVAIEIDAQVHALLRPSPGTVRLEYTLIRITGVGAGRDASNTSRDLCNARGSEDFAW